jgi:hypothetical protein
MRPERLFRVNLISLIRFVKKFLKWRKKRLIYGLGFLPDRVDDRDIVYNRLRRFRKDLPESTNMVNISRFPFRYDQGQLGSCVGHGVSGAFRRVLQVNKMEDFEPSRLFAYYIARREKNEDTGASIRDAFKAMNREGLCNEKTWPYIERKFSVKPPEEAFKEAEDHQTIRYERIFPASREAIMDAIYQGFPVVYGQKIFESFLSDEVARTGVVPHPNEARETFYGWHCKVIFDYESDYVIELNSWGKKWGLNGLCKIPWSMILDPEISRDFWVIYLTE